MIVKDIYEDVRSVTNYADESLNFSRISDAVEVLSNKVDFDALLGYVTMSIPEDGILTLPREVETPLRVNIDGNPTFTRDKLYEFTLNGPGSDTERVGWTWEDKGTTTLFRNCPEGEKFKIYSTSSADDGLQVTFTYPPAPEDDWDNDRYKETLTLSHLSPPEQAFASILPPIAVSKPLTTGYVYILSSDSSTKLAFYAPNETDPSYRRIKLSKKSGTAYILFRRNRYQVHAQTDFIPIRSKMGLLLMVKALEAYRQERFDVAKALEDQSIKLASEEQARHNGFIDIAKDAEVGSIMNIDFRNSDSVIVGDLYDEACKIVGPVGQQKVMDYVTEAVTILSNKAQWDAQRGYIDILTDQYQYVTLPRFVEYVIELNVDGRPVDMRSKWFQFNLNGPGEQYLSCGSWEDNGRVVTLRDVPYTQKLSAVPDSPADSGLEIWVYGSYAGQQIFTPQEDGSLKEGFPVPVDITTSNVSTQPVDVIYRIVKPASQGFIKLMGRDTLDQENILLGYYWPDETEPNYRRIKISPMGARVRIMYRRKSLKFTSLSDPINLRSKTAVLTMLRSMMLMAGSKIAEANALEASALKLLVEENRINNQSEVMNIDFGRNFTASDQFIPFA